MSDSRQTRLRWLGALAGSFAWLCPAHADTSNATGLDAEVFIARFEAENPRLDLIDAEVDRAEAGVEAARVLPGLALSYQLEEVFPDSGSLAENTISVHWSLDLSGGRGRRVAAARHGVSAAESRGERARLVMIVDALEVYYGAARARHRVAALRDGRAPLARIVDALNKRVARGDAAGYDLARLELELARFDERIAEAETELEVAGYSMGALLGDASATYEATDALALPTAPASVDALAAEAITDREDYRAASADARGGQSLIDAAGRWWIPQLDLSLGLKTQNTGTETATGFVAGFSLELPVFSRGRAESQLGAAAKRSAHARMKILEREIPAQIRSAHELLDSRIERARRFETTQLAAIDAIVKTADTIYDAGEGSVVELLDAYRVAVETRLGYIDLRWNARLAELELWRVLGRRPGTVGGSN